MKNLVCRIETVQYKLQDHTTWYLGHHHERKNPNFFRVKVAALLSRKPLGSVKIKLYAQGSYKLVYLFTMMKESRVLVVKSKVNVVASFRSDVDKTIVSFQDDTT
jgi:hypothetical protein